MKKNKSIIAAPFNVTGGFTGISKWVGNAVLR